MDDWIDALLGIGRIAAPIIGASISSSANDDATQTMIQGTQAQADQLQQGIDERLIAQLGGIDNAREWLSQRTKALVDIYQQAATRYGGDVQAAARAYAQALPQAASLIGDVLTTGTVNAGQAMRQAAATAGGRFTGSAATYSGAVTGAADEYAGTLTGAADLYGDQVGAAADRFGTDIMRAPEAVRAELGSYADAGQRTLPAMEAIAFSSPNTLTESQRLALEDYQRSAAARLASSGLRGAGRAGIAAMDEGDARMRAQFYDQNRSRSDSFLNTLGARGYQASSTIGEAERQAITRASEVSYAAAERAAGVSFDATARGAAARQQAHQMAAQAAMQAEQQAARLGYDAETAAQQAYLTTLRQVGSYQWTGAQQGAQAMLGAAKDVAGTNLRAADATASEMGRYYDTERGYATQEAGYVGDALYGKREAEARAVGPVAALQGANQTANGQLWGTAAGTLLRSIADTRNYGDRPSLYGNDTFRGGNDTPVGGFGSDEYGGYL